MRALLLFLLCLLPSAPVAAYGILTHEAIIDARWNPVILPALKARFPQTNNDSL